MNEQRAVLGASTGLNCSCSFSSVTHCDIPSSVMGFWCRPPARCAGRRPPAPRLALHLNSVTANQRRTYTHTPLVSHCTDWGLCLCVMVLCLRCVSRVPCHLGSLCLCLRPELSLLLRQLARTDGDSHNWLISLSLSAAHFSV